MIKQISKFSKLQKSDVRNIKRLVDLCKKNDGYAMKVYWHIIPNRLTQEFNDFMYFIDGNLVGYLALFTFETNEVELTACIHPKYRHRGIFKKLMTEALLEIHQRNIPNCLWICPQGSPISTSQMETVGGEYRFSQVEMLATHPAINKPRQNITLREASITDLNILAQMGATAFKSSYSETLERFTENMQEKNRKIWLVLNENQENIGKIHVRYDDNKTAFIHDLCTIPELQGRGYGFSMITETMDILKKTGWNKLVLDVECDNKGALKLYEQCGFEVTDGYDFWTVPTKNLLG